MNAIILARVSTREQQEEGFSIDSQIRRLRDYAAAKGLTILREFQIAESSTKDTRRKFEAVLSMIRAEKEKVALITDTIDRLQRSFRESVTLDDLRRAGRLEIHFYRESLVLTQSSNSSDLLRWDMGVMFARGYVLQLSDNVKRSFDQKLRNGEWIGKAPVGYIAVRTEDGSTYVHDPEKAPLVRDIFSRYATGTVSMASLARDLAPAGLRGSTGKPLSVSMVEHILKNTFYYGEMVVRGVPIAHKYKPIVARALFDQAQAVRASWHKKPVKYASKPFPFRGMITCGECGSIVSGEIQKGHTYYSCRGKTPHKKRTYFREEKVCAAVMESFRRIAFPERLVPQIIERIRAMETEKNQYHRSMVDTLNAESRRIDVQMSRVLNLLINETISEDVYSGKVRELKQRQAEIISELGRYSAADEQFYLTVGRVLDVIRRADQIFEGSRPAGKRQIAKLLLSNLSVEGANLRCDLHSALSPLQKLPSWAGKLPVQDDSRTVRALSLLPWKRIVTELHPVEILAVA